MVNSQYTHTHGNPDPNLLLRFQLQSPKNFPRHHGQRNIRARAPRRIENAIPNAHRGIPTRALDQRVPRFRNRRTLHPRECCAGNHDEEQCDDAEPDESAEEPGGEPQESDAETDFGKCGCEAGKGGDGCGAQGDGGQVGEGDVEGVFAESEVHADLGGYCFGEEEDLVGGVSEDIWDCG
jgi:hypothetical protein